jgi:hypothetical protein
MTTLFVGLAVGFALAAFVWHVKNKNRAVSIFGWLLSLGLAAYAAFVLLVIIEFIKEGTPQGALVNGSLLLVPAAVWAVVIKRFFLKSDQEMADVK